MMSRSSEHHATAEQMLDLAHAEQDSTRRGQILAEAQVHATLALSAPAEIGLGQDEALSTESTLAEDPGVPEGSSQNQRLYYLRWRLRRLGIAIPARPETAPGKSTRRRRETGRSTPRTPSGPGAREHTGNPPVRPKAEPRPVSAPAAPQPAPPAPPDTTPPPFFDPGPGGPTRPSPAAGDPGDQKPGGPAPSF
jgi:hypothetical protein